MFWNSDSWNGFPQTATLTTFDRSIPSVANRLLMAPIISALAVSSPFFMA